MPRCHHTQAGAHPFCNLGLRDLVGEVKQLLALPAGCVERAGGPPGLLQPL